jgi:hypothetical protein
MVEVDSYCSLLGYDKVLFDRWITRFEGTYYNHIQISL